MLVWYVFELIVLVPLLFVFAVLCFFMAPYIALIVMVVGGLSYYAKMPTPNELKIGAKPVVMGMADYGKTIVDNGLLEHGKAAYSGYATIRVTLTNNSPVSIFSVELLCRADDIEYDRSTTSFNGYWSGRLLPGENTVAEAYIREVHSDPKNVDQRTLQCKIGEVMFDRPKAMLALGSDNSQTLVETRYDVAIRDLDPGDNESGSRNQITISGAISNRSRLPVYGATFECYLDGQSLRKFSTKFEAPVPPNSRRAFQVTDSPRSFRYDDRKRVNTTSCAVFSYDFGDS